MFLRISKVTRRQRTYEYAQLVESFRRKSDGMPQHRVIANLGTLSPLEVQNLRASLEASRKGRRVLVATTPRSKLPAPKPQANLRYLDIAVALELWREWGLGEMLQMSIPQGEQDVSVAKVVAALTIQRLLAPNSKLAATRWFPRTALPELLNVTPSQFNNTRVHRALDALDAASPTLMARLPRLYRERNGDFVSLFMDVTDTWFVGHGPQLAARAKTKEGVVRRKIHIVLLCNERGYPLRWEVIRGNQPDGMAMTDMLQAVSGLDWVGDAPVVLDRAMGSSAYIRAMSATQLKFLTALTRTEYSRYATEVPWKVLEDLPHGDASNDTLNVTSDAARRVEAAGMERVNDNLLVLDCGVVELAGAAPSDLLHTNSPARSGSSEGRNARALRLSQQADRAVTDGRYSSYAAAGAALGVKKSTLNKYRLLLKLADDLQQQVLDGKAARWPISTLIRIAQLSDAQAQRAAFEALLQSAPPRKASGSAPAPQTCSPSTQQDMQEPQRPLRVRVVVYFNPEQFVEQRRVAAERLRRIEQLVANLNSKLSSPRSKQTPEKIYATIDRCLRREGLIDAFETSIQDREFAGLRRYQAKVELRAEAWRRRHRYDGFSVLVGHADLPHTAAQLCRLYRAKDTVEKDFQVIKSVLELRPVRHRRDHKVRAHVTLSMLSLLLERTLRDKLSGRYSVGQALELLEPCRLNRYSTDDGPAVYTITETDNEQRAVLRKLRLQHLASDDHVAAKITPR